MTRRKSVKIPVIGMGGISTAADVIEFMLAGADRRPDGHRQLLGPWATEKIAANWQLVHGARSQQDLRADRRIDSVTEELFTTQTQSHRGTKTKRDWFSLWLCVSVVRCMGSRACHFLPRPSIQL